MTQLSLPRQPQYTPDTLAWYRPIIGIPWSAGRRAGLFAPIWRAYLEAIEAVGGTPILLPPIPDGAAFAPLWQWLDGLLLPGGVDIEPETYGEAPHPLLGTVDPKADRLELWLAQEVLERDLPLLGINRGLQVLNVACQGTLYQDVGAELDTTWSHLTMGQPRAARAHPVNVVPGTRLAELLGPEPAWVNSLHHQAIKDVGVGVAIATLAPDDVIEAIELPEKRFALGVQWAIEALAATGDERMQRVFAGFVEAARAAGMERKARLLHGRAALERWERMWVRALVAYCQGRERLFGEEPLDDLEALELRQTLPVLKGRVQAITEALHLPDPTPPVGRL